MLRLFTLAQYEKLHVTIRGIKGQRVLDLGKNLAQGVASSLIADKVQGAIDAPNTGAPDGDSTLTDVHRVLVELHQFLTQQPNIDQYVERFYQLSKAGSGPPVQPEKIGDRLYIWMLTFAPLVLDITAPGLGTLTLTPTPGTWFPTDYPDNTTYILDASNVLAQQNILVRYTNVKL